MATIINDVPQETPRVNVVPNCVGLLVKFGDSGCCHGTSTVTKPVTVVSLSLAAVGDGGRDVAECCQQSTDTC